MFIAMHVCMHVRIARGQGEGPDHVPLRDGRKQLVRQAAKPAAGTASKSVASFGAKGYTPEITKVKFRWKTPLKIIAGANSAGEIGYLGV